MAGKYETAAVSDSVIAQPTTVAERRSVVQRSPNEFKTSSTAEPQRSTVGGRPSKAGEQKYRAMRKRWPRLENATQGAVEAKVSIAGSRS